MDGVVDSKYKIYKQSRKKRDKFKKKKKLILLDLNERWKS